MLSSLALHSEQVIPARVQMGSSLGFHIILACMGIGFPVTCRRAGQARCFSSGVRYPGSPRRRPCATVVATGILGALSVVVANSG